MRTDLEVFVEFLVEHHCAATFALGPQALGNLAFLGLAASNFWFLDERGVRMGGIGRHRRFAIFQAESFFGKGGRGHSAKYIDKG